MINGMRLILWNITKQLSGVQRKSILDWIIWGKLHVGVLEVNFFDF